ncbi:MAG: saccharopine dehydrogenase, partial [Devosiaceae bacterium]|nr:saccharopine dehydrogenase [Devosiaceae bacterium]
MQPHIWVRAEQRDNEQRVGMTPQSVSALAKAGYKITIENSSRRAIPISQYENLDCEIVEENTWPDAPSDTIIFGLKELPDDGTPLPHRHIFFGHAFKGQAEGPELLRRFAAGGGTLYDLEYLIDKDGNRVTAFSYWAGLAGAAVGLKTWAAQQTGKTLGPISAYPDKDALLNELNFELSEACKNGTPLPTALIIGALGRVGGGAIDLFQTLDITPTKWDMEQTASGGPFPEILEHNLLVNCILASPDVPVFVPKSALNAKRKLSVIADIACDPNSPYNPL